MQEQAYEQLTLFPEGSPVSPFPWLESKKERGTTVTYGRRCSELSASCAHVASSVRMYLESSRLPPGVWSRIWSKLGITSSCSILRLRLSERGTEELAFSSSGALIGTPTACARERSGPRGSNGAEHDLKHGNLKGTVMYATPCAGDALGTSGGNNCRSLRTDIGGQLNPEWVEWLMGFPAGWTE